MENYCSRYIEKPSAALRWRQLRRRAKMLSVTQCVRAFCSALCELRRKRSMRGRGKKKLLWSSNLSAHRGVMTSVFSMERQSDGPGWALPRRDTANQSILGGFGVTTRRVCSTYGYVALASFPHNGSSAESCSRWERVFMEELFEISLPCFVCLLYIWNNTVGAFQDECAGPNFSFHFIISFFFFFLPWKLTQEFNFMSFWEHDQ